MLLLELITRSNLPWWAGEIKVCILEEQLSINSKNACELEAKKKKVGHSVLDSGKSVCKVPEAGMSLVLKKQKV